MSDGVDARRVALEALGRIDEGGAYAHLVLPALLERSDLAPRDRAFVTELVYGTTRMRRACDFLVDRFLVRQLDPPVRNALRLGAYQLHMLRTPAHAAVAATVSAAPPKAKGLVNAVLRRVAERRDQPVQWPDLATRLSYPEWVVERLATDLGEHDALAAMEAMNAPAPAVERADGYGQDLASQWVAEQVGASAGDRVADLCAAPGGKATAMAGSGAVVFASDLRPGRARMLRANADRLGLPAVRVLVADGRHPPYPAASFDRVLVDAPCSGLGALRRRPDARWRARPADVERLASLQRELVDAAALLVRPGGVLAYSVCTLTATESLGIDQHLGDHLPGWEPIPLPAPWRPWARGGVLLPQDAGTDGMAALYLRRPRR